MKLSKARPARALPPKAAKVYEEGVKLMEEGFKAAAAASGGVVAGGAVEIARRPTSQRISPNAWKRPKKQASSQARRLTPTWEEKNRVREELARAKAEEQTYRELAQAERAEERRRREQRLRAKEAAQRRGMVVQKITNTQKLRKLTPAQMRKLVRISE